MTCGYCHNEITGQQSAFCPHCGMPLPEIRTAPSSDASDDEAVAVKIYPDTPELEADELDFLYQPEDSAPKTPGGDKHPAHGSAPSLSASELAFLRQMDGDVQVREPQSPRPPQDATVDFATRELSAIREQINASRSDPDSPDWDSEPTREIDLEELEYLKSLAAKKQKQSTIWQIPRNYLRQHRKICITAVCGLVVLILAISWIRLSVRTSPNQFIKELNQAIVDQDIDALSAMLAPEDGYSITDSELIALCNGLRGPDIWQDFQDNLRGQLRGQEGSAEFDAFAVEREPLIAMGKNGWFPEYTIAMKPVTLLVDSNAQPIAIELDSSSSRISQLETGQWSVRTLPGKYTLSATIPTNYNQAQVTVETGLCLSASQPQEVALEFAVFPITIHCPDVTDVTVYINGYPTEIKPVNGEISIPNAENGMVIQAVARHGDSRFNDEIVVTDQAATYAFAFDIDDEMAAMLEELLESGVSETDIQIAQDLYLYYNSYVDCINDQSTQGLERVTESYAELAEDWVYSNLEYLFQFTRMVVDLDSYQYGYANGTATVTVRFEYQYRKRDETAVWSTRQSVQRCSMAYDDEEEVWNVRDIEIDNLHVLGGNQLIME